jgi:hypothetical protein
MFAKSLLAKTRSRQTRVVSLALCGASVSATALAADDKVVQAAFCVRHAFAAPVTYGYAGVSGDRFSPPLPEVSWVFCPLVRDNADAEISSISIQVTEAHAGDANEMISCTVCTHDGTKERCTTPVTASANGTQSIAPNMTTVTSFVNEGYVVFCSVGKDSRIRSITYVEP